MKLLRFGAAGAEKPGLLDAKGVLRDLSGIIPDLAGKALTSASLAKIGAIDPESLPAVAGAPRIGACVGDVRNFIAVGLNFADHAAETGAEIPKEPILFNKAPNCIVGPHDDVIIPKGSKKTDWEVELAIVIGDGGSYIPEDKAMAAIAGFAVCNDVSEREFQIERGGQWAKGKGCPTFGPLGPWLVTTDEVKDVQNLAMWLEVDGERVQNGSSKTTLHQPVHAAGSGRCHHHRHAARRRPRLQAAALPQGRRGRQARHRGPGRAAAALQGLSGLRAPLH